MPVGTAVLLRIGDRPGADEVPGKVELVSESQELARAGMRVRFADPAAAALFGTPSEAGPEPEPETFLPESTAVDASPVGLAEAPRDAAAPDGAASNAQSGHRRIVVDASTEARDVGTPAPAEVADVELSGPSGNDGGRIPAPDASAFGPAHRKTRRNKRQR
ncbi:MAG: hypothetical protein ABUR63_05940 [Verrucomicrobiota bacterium]